MYNQCITILIHLFESVLFKKQNGIIYVHCTKIFIFEWKMVYLTTFPYPFMCPTLSPLKPLPSISWCGLVLWLWIECRPFLSGHCWKCQTGVWMRGLEWQERFWNYLCGSESMSEWVLGGWLNWGIVVWSITRRVRRIRIAGHHRSSKVRGNQ